MKLKILHKTNVSLCKREIGEGFKAAVVEEKDFLTALMQEVKEI